MKNKAGATSPAFRVDIYRGWCKKCGICVAFCPRQVLESDGSGYPVVREAGRCTGCNLCVHRCPDFAITIHGSLRNHEKEESDDGN